MNITIISPDNRAKGEIGMNLFILELVVGG
jgi:hypothetical protein